MPEVSAASSLMSGARPVFGLVAAPALWLWCAQYRELLSEEHVKQQGRQGDSNGSRIGPAPGRHIEHGFLNPCRA